MLRKAGADAWHALVRDHAVDLEPHCFGLLALVGHGLVGSGRLVRRGRRGSWSWTTRRPCGPIPQPSGFGMCAVDPSGRDCVVAGNRRCAESLWVTFPAACGVSPSHDQRRRQEAGLGLPEATREPPTGALLKYPAACGGDPLLARSASGDQERSAPPTPSTSCPVDPCNKAVI